MKTPPTIERLHELLRLDPDGVLRWRVSRGPVKQGAEAFTAQTSKGRMPARLITRKSIAPASSSPCTSAVGPRARSGISTVTTPTIARAISPTP